MLRLVGLTVVAIVLATMATLWSVPPGGLAQPAKTAKPTDSVRRVGVEELQEAMARGTAVAVDVRSERAFRADHIVGAIWLPHTRMDRHLDRLPRNRTLVFYCA